MPAWSLFWKKRIHFQGNIIILYIRSHLLLRTQSTLTESTQLLSVFDNKGSNSSTWSWYYLLLVSLVPFFRAYLYMFGNTTCLLMEKKSCNRRQRNTKIWIALGSIKKSRHTKIGPFSSALSWYFSRVYKKLRLYLENRASLSIS